MKVKHIITTFGIILCGVAATQGAGAILKYVDSSDVQFNFGSMLGLTLTGDRFEINDLTPNNSKISNPVTATVSTNSSAGYKLSATVGNGTTYTSTSLVGSVSGTIAMMGSGTSLASGTWGYTLNGSATTPTYGALDTEVPRVLNETTNAAGAPATGYAGGSTTTMHIGAYAAAAQAPGEYRNVVNFEVVANVVMRTVTLSAGSNVASVTLNSSGTSGSYAEGSNLSITATCDTGYTFNNWSKSDDYGNIANANLASTTFTVGASDTTITAYCKASS